MVREAELLDEVPDGLFIGGEWILSSSAATFDVDDPSTGAVIKWPADAAPRRAVRALEAAVAAQKDRAAAAPRVRGEIPRGAFGLLRERKDDAALLMTLEMGKPLADSYAEVAYGGEFLRWFSGESVRISGRHGRNPEGTGTIGVSQRPMGPCTATNRFIRERGHVTSATV